MTVGTSASARAVATVPRTTATTVAPTTPIARVPTRVRAAFAPFRGRPEGLPVRVMRVMRVPLEGANWRLAQRLRLPGGAEVWAVPGRNVLCLVSQRRAGEAVTAGCTTPARAMLHGVVLTSLATGDRSVVGLVPDRARRARLSTPGAADHVVPVTANTFAVHDAGPEPPDLVTLLR